MKIDRLIGIIIILLQQDKITAPELAERFEVSRRTINRDIENICKAGIPVVTTQGYNGGISIADGYKIDKSFFTRDELQTILTGLKGIDSVSQTPYLTKFLDKLSSKQQKMVVEDFIVIDLASHYQVPLTQKIEMIKHSIINRHVISFTYYYSKGEGGRKIEPYRLIFKWSSWYVFGYCLDRNDYRLFKLNRLWNLQEQENYSIRSIPDEKLQFEKFLTEQEVELKAVFCKSEKHRLIEEYGIESYSVLNNGQLLFKRNFVNYENMREWVLSFGDKVCVLAPEQLKIDRQNQAKNILQEDIPNSLL